MTLAGAMLPLARELTELLAIIVRSSWQACVLAVLVLLLQRLLAGRVSAAVRYNLWLLVFLRLILPVTPPSRFSLFNLSSSAWPNKPTPTMPPPASVTANSTSSGITDNTLSGMLVDRAGSMTGTVLVLPTTADRTPDAAGDATTMTGMAGSISADPADTAATGTVIDVPSQAAAWRSYLSLENLWLAAGIIWLSGAAFLSLRMFRATLVFRRMLHRLRPVEDPCILATVAVCAHELGLKRIPRVLVAPATQGPLLAGWLRPALLLPEDAAQTLNDRELRLVLLHEMAHMRRRDVLANWLLTLLGIVHWFNPMLPWLLRRVRADRELAVDETVLVTAGRQHRQAYGRTLLKLLATLSRQTFPALPGARPVLALAGPAPAGAVGILERDGKRNLLRRITMIARFDPSGRRRIWTVLAGAAAVLLGGAALTDSVRDHASAQDAPAAVSADKPATNPASPNDPEMRSTVARALRFLRGADNKPATVAPAPTPAFVEVEVAPGGPAGIALPAPVDPTAPKPALVRVQPVEVVPRNPNAQNDRARKAEIEAKMDQLRAERQIAVEQYKLKSIDVRRMEELLKKGAVSPIEVERAQVEAQIAKAQIDAVEAAMASLNKIQPDVLIYPVLPGPVLAPPTPGAAPKPPVGIDFTPAPKTAERVPSGGGGPVPPMAVVPGAGGNNYPATVAKVAPPNLVIRAYDVSDLIKDTGPNTDSASQLVNLVRNMVVGFDQWSKTTGQAQAPTARTISIFREKLIVKATEADQKEIEQLLDLLRREPAGKTRRGATQEKGSSFGGSPSGTTDPNRLVPGKYGVGESFPAPKEGNKPPLTLPPGWDRDTPEPRPLPTPRPMPTPRPEPRPVPTPRPEPKLDPDATPAAEPETGTGPTRVNVDIKAASPASKAGGPSISTGGGSDAGSARDEKAPKPASN